MQAVQGGISSVTVRSKTQVRLRIRLYWTAEEQVQTSESGSSAMYHDNAAKLRDWTVRSYILEAAVSKPKTLLSHHNLPSRPVTGSTNILPVNGSQSLYNAGEHYLK